MEVDLLSRGMRVAIELDGPQHLNDAVAYRRDRHKDRLFQEHGYWCSASSRRTWRRTSTGCSTRSSAFSLIGYVRRDLVAPAARSVARKGQEEGNVGRPISGCACN